MNALLTAGTGLSKIACSAEECLSWIIILLNILTVFYLVFCAWFKVTKTVRIIGYVWGSALAVGTIAVVAVHTCVFTILSAVFTGLILMAVLSIVFDKGVLAAVKKDDEEEKPLKAAGAYVIHRTDDNKYTFLLYNAKKVAVCKANYKFDTLEEVKKAIAVCRENGLFVAVENKTKSWIEFVNHPKFIMFEENGKFRFHMTAADSSIILLSEVFEINEKCEKTMNEAVLAVKSDKMYYSEKDVLSGRLFQSFFELSENDESAGAETEQVVENETPVVPSAVVSDDVAATVESDDDDEEETIEVTDEEGNRFRIRFNKSFTAKLSQASDEAKKYYNELKNDVLAYNKTKTRISWSFDSINAGRSPLIKFGVRGKTLCVYFALNPDDYIDTKYKVEKMEALKYESVPCMYRIKNDRRLKYAKQLIAVVCQNVGLQQGLIASEDYTVPYEPTSDLIEKGLVKQVKVKI